MKVVNKLIIYSISLIILFTMINPTYIKALDYPEIDSEIVEIYDLTDKKVIYEVDSNKVASIASLTKIVTTITAIENISNLDEEVTITNKILNTVRWDLAKAGLKAGDKVTYRDLLYASMLPSGADATNSLAILSSDSIENFVEKMNNFVKDLGLENTHFVNVTGLDEEDHYSTADDIRVILEYALKNETFREVFTTDDYTLSNNLVVHSTMGKYAKTAYVDKTKVLGSKTGYTGDAGYCLAALTNVNSHEFIIVVLKATNKNNQFNNIVDTLTLTDFLNENYSDRTLIKNDELIKTIPVKLSTIESYEIRTTKDIKLYLPSDYEKDKIKIEYDGLEELSYENKIGEKIGTVYFYYDNNLISQEDILLETSIQMSLSKMFNEYKYLIIPMPFILFAIIILIIRKKNLSKKKKRT